MPPGLKGPGSSWWQISNINASVQKGGITGLPGCIELTTKIWEAIKQTKMNHLSLYIVWLDLTHAYGSVHHQLVWRAPENHQVMRPIIQILQIYFDGFEMRFTALQGTSLKPMKSRSLTLTRGNICKNFFFVAGQRIPTAREVYTKSLGRNFDELLISQVASIKRH